MMIQALMPVFVLIMLGFALHRSGFPGDGFWRGAEQLTYYLLFPVMLVYKLGGANLAQGTFAEVGQVVLAMLLSMGLLLLLLQRIFRWSGPVFTSVFQGGIRFNSFVGLAAAALLFGDHTLSLMAIAIAIKVPLINLSCILVFALFTAGQIKLVPVLKQVVRNPLIIGSVIGASLSYFQVGIHPWLASVLQPLSDLALPLGLMTVGAGLQFKALREASTPFLVAALVKLLGFPILTALILLLLDIHGPLAAAALLLSSLPTASSAYILARQLGGDAPLMAAIISGQTLLAMVSMPLMLAWLV